MVPSSREIIESIRHGLSAQVVPTVNDKVGLSVLRSIDTLLAHLAVRVEDEQAILAADNADLRALLGAPGASDEAGPTVAELASRNAALRGQLDAELAAVIDRHDTARLAELDAYFTRRLARENPLVFPAFAGRTY